MFAKNIKGVLCDIGGVLYVGDEAISGAVDAVERIKQRYPIRFLTNTTQKTGVQVVQKLRQLGFEISHDEVITALDVTMSYLMSKQSSAEFLLTDDAMEFFKPLEKYPKKYVVVGDAQHNFNYENLNKAFRTLDKGAKLIAIANNRYFKDNDGALSMDAGCFVSALEYASGQKAHLIGKPSKEFYHLAARSLGVDSKECVMIGDDIESDVAGAQRAGLTGVLVKTGKFSESDLQRQIIPEIILDSIAGV